MAALLGAALFACGSERTVTPHPSDYRLYAVATISGETAIDVIDAEADSILHRIPSAGLNSPDYLEVSGDGRYLATFSGGVESGISLFDLQTETIVASNLIRTEYATFVTKASLLAGILSDSMFVYKIPDLSIDTVIPTDIHFFVSTSKEREVMGVSQHTMPTYYGLRRYSGENWVLTDSFTFRSPATDGPIAVFQATSSPDGDRLYLLGADGAGPCVFAIDLDTHNVLFRKSVETFFGWIEVAPDGTELWITQSFPAMFPLPPSHLGYVLMMDAVSGSPLDTLRTLGLNTYHPSEPLPLQQIVFHPDDEKAYVMAFMASPGILVIDTKLKQQVSSWYNGSPQGLWDIALGPGQN